MSEDTEITPVPVKRAAQARLSREMQSEDVREGTGRKKRTPLSAVQQRLQVRNCPPGYVARWVNDTGGRIQLALQGDYQFVTDEGVLAERAGTAGAESDRRVSYIVDKSTGMRAYLMAIRQEFYDEDQKAKQAHLDKTDQALKKGQHAREADDGRYEPEMIKRKGMVKISREDIGDDEE